MANAEAFDSGFDAGMGKKKQKQKKTSAPDEKSPTPEKRDFAPKAVPSSFQKGGRVKRTGKALVHKGEMVLTAHQQKAAGLKKGGKKKTSAHKRIASKG